MKHPNLLALLLLFCPAHAAMAADFERFDSLKGRTGEGPRVESISVALPQDPELSRPGRPRKKVTLPVSVDSEYSGLFRKPDGRGGGITENGACAKLVQLLADPDVTRTHGFTVLREGKPIFEAYTNQQLAGPDTSQKMFSMSKSLHVALLGLLNQGVEGLEVDGKRISLPPLPLDARLSDELGSEHQKKYFAAFDPSGQRISTEVRVGHLLKQSTGIKWCELENCGGATSWLSMSCTEARKNPLDFVLSQGMARNSQGQPVAPGAQFDYSSGNMVLAAELIKKRAERNGVSVNALYRALLAKMGIRNAVVGKAGGAVMAGSDMMMSHRDLLQFSDFFLRRKGHGEDGKSLFTDSFRKMVYSQNPDICRSERLTDNESGPTFVGLWATGTRDCPGRDRGTWLEKDHPPTLVLAGYGGMQCAHDDHTGLTYCRSASDTRSHGPVWDPFLRRARACFSKDVEVAGKKLHAWLPPAQPGTNKRDYGSVDFDKPAATTPGGSAGGVLGLPPEQMAAILGVLEKNPLPNCAALDLCNCVNVTLAKLGDRSAALAACRDRVAPRQFLGALDGINGYLQRNGGPTGKALLADGEALRLDAKQKDGAIVTRLVLRAKSGGQTVEREIGSAAAAWAGPGEQCEVKAFARPLGEQFQEFVAKARRAGRADGPTAPAPGHGRVDTAR